MTPYWYQKTCYYCRQRKPDAIRDQDGSEIARLMYSELIPYYPTNPFLQGIMKWRYIYICNDCMEWMI